MGDDGDAREIGEGEGVGGAEIEGLTGLEVLRLLESTSGGVLYDDRDLYVGIIARDREPHRVLRPLGRRDSQPYSDMVAVVVDQNVRVAVVLVRGR